MPASSAIAQNSSAVPDTSPKPDAFEVATIKPHPGVDGVISSGGPPGRYNASNITAKMLIEQAFDLPADQVTGGPPWIESQHLDVNAKIADDRWQQISKLHNEEKTRAIDAMLQALLEERFGLVISHHPKELTVYALVLAKGGSKLPPAGSPRSKGPSGSFMMGMTQNDIPVIALARFLSSHFHRMVLDQTGLTGRYDINFTVPIPEERTPEASDEAIFQALEDELGLKLVSRKAVVDTINIDHLEQPSEN